MAHLSDEELILLMDGEGAGAGHLAACGVCQGRMEAMRGTLARVDEVMGGEVVSVGARRRLREEMRGTRWGAVAAAALVIGMVLWGGVHWRERGAMVVADVGRVPDRVLTPGVTRPVTLSEICSVDDDDLDPALPDAVQHAVLTEYGIPADEMGRKYQIDYLVNPQLGGTNDIRNLWPQADEGGELDARAKDRLEERLHQMVCSRAIDLGTAQKAMMTDWVAAYRKYVSTT